jgi:glutamine amidotransferase PdxT
MFFNHPIVEIGREIASRFPEFLRALKGAVFIREPFIKKLVKKSEKIYNLNNE